jgi:hypothetical protein
MACGLLSGCSSNRCRRASSICLIWPITKPSRAMSRSSSAETFGGSGEPSGVDRAARCSAALRRVGLKFRMPSRASVPSMRFTSRVRSLTRHSRSRLGRLASSSASVGTRTMLQWPRSPPQLPQGPPLEQFGVQPIGFRPAMFPRYRDTRGMDHLRLDGTRRKPARQPEAVAAGFKGQRNPRDCAAGPDRLVTPAMRARKPMARPNGVSPRRDQWLKSISLQRRVRVSRNFALPRREAGFSRGCAGRAGGDVGRDAQGSSTSRPLPVMSLSGPIPVPQCRP